MKDSFDKVDNDYRIINILENIKNISIEKYHEWTNECSGAKTSITNDKIRNISYEFASFIAGLETKINQLYGLGCETEYNYKHKLSLKHLKNKIVDIILPNNREHCKNREEYQINMKKASKLADSLEDFFMLAYSLGKSSQIIMDEKCNIDEKCFKEYMENCHQRLQRAYDEGSKGLIMMLQLAMSSPEAMKEFKDRGML